MRMRVIRGLSRLNGTMRGDGLRARLVRGALGSAGMQAASRALALVLGIILARTLGPEGYGIYAYAFAIMSLLMVVAEAGVPTLLMREVAAAEGRGAWGLLRGALLRGLQLVGMASVTIAALGLVTLALFADRMAPASFQTMAVMLLVLPAAALSKTVARGLMGLQRVVTAQALTLILRPLLVISLVGALFFLSPDLRAPSVAMAGQLVAVVGVLVIGTLLLKRSIPIAAREAQAQFENRLWLKSALPFTLIGGALVINNQADVVMLGWLTMADEVGVYRVAVRGAGLVIFSLQAVSAIVAPQISRLHAQQNNVLLQLVITRAVMAITIPALAVVVVLVVGGQELLTWVFGVEFAAGYEPLVILAVGQLAVAVFGISGPLLSMCGFQKMMSNAIWVVTIVNVIMNFLLIPWLGATGAAVSTASTLCAWSMYLAWFSYMNMGIHIVPKLCRR